MNDLKLTRRGENLRDAFEGATIVALLVVLALFFSLLGS